MLEHLDACASCRERLAAAGRIEARLKAELHDWDCPPPDLLGHYVLGLLGSAERVRFAAHVQLCAACAEEVAALRSLLGAETATFTQAPTTLRRPLPPPIVARRLSGVPALALRGAAPDPLIVEVGAVSLVLQARPGAGGPTLVGQLVAEDQRAWAGALAEARQSGVIRAVAHLSDQGGFSCVLPNVEPVDLRIVAEGAAPILVEQITFA